MAVYELTLNIYVLGIIMKILKIEKKILTLDTLKLQSIKD